MRRILLDTDLAMGVPGSEVDDGFALALAVADPDLRVELVTTVGGNSDVDTSTRLSEALLDRLGRDDIPVVRGAATPLDTRWRRPSSRGGLVREIAPSDARQGSAAEALVDRVLAEPGALTIVAIGPLTNVALALLLDPALAGAVEEIVVMGGAYFKHTNDLSQPAERNFWCDPQAASIVLASGTRLRLVGLDVTEQVRLTRADTAAMAASSASFTRFAARCADEWITFKQHDDPRDERRFDSCALHDPLAVAVVAHRELVTWRSAHVAVETYSSLTRGIAIADLTFGDTPEHNCQIATAVDHAAFRSFFFDRMGVLP